MAYRFIVLELAYKVVLRSGDKSFDEFDWETKFSEESLTIAIAIGRSLRYQEIIRFFEKRMRQLRQIQ